MVTSNPVLAFVGYIVVAIVSGLAMLIILACLDFQDEVKRAKRNREDTK